MRKNWGEPPRVEVEVDALSRLLRLALPTERAVAFDCARGGLANANLRVRLAPSGREVLVRFFVRDPRSAAKEAALLQRLAGVVPVPQLLGFVEAGRFEDLPDYPCSILEWVYGERLEGVAAGLDAGSISPTCRAVGAALAAVHRLKFPAMGFLDGALSVAQPIDADGGGLAGFLRDCLTRPPANERMPAELTADLLAFAQRHGALLNTWTAAPCLAHADFGGSNIIMRQDAHAWSVAAIVDWEFAFSGTPFFDLGNLLRPPFGERPGVAAAVAEGYTDVGGELPERWLEMARLVDLTAWAEFLTRPNASAALVRDAIAMLRWIMDQAGPGRPA